jgi:hypothetical protein
MRTAKLQVNGKFSGKTMVIDLVYNYFSDNTWKCPPGYLRATSGTWIHNGQKNGYWPGGGEVYFYDDQHQLIATADHMDLNGPRGYPFTGLTGTGYGGEPEPAYVINGPPCFMAFDPRGIFSNEICRWKFLST